MKASSQHQVCSLATMDLGNRMVAHRLWNQITWFCYLTKLAVTILRFLLRKRCEKSHHLTRWG